MPDFSDLLASADHRTVSDVSLTHVKLTLAGPESADDETCAGSGIKCKDNNLCGYSGPNGDLLSVYMSNCSVANNYQSRQIANSPYVYQNITLPTNFDWR